MGAGQFCTNPGLAIVLDGPEADAFADAAAKALGDVAEQIMLTDGIASAYHKGVAEVADSEVTPLLSTTCTGRSATPYLFSTTAEDWLANDVLAEEVFGPMGIIVRAKNADERNQIANAIVGQLTCTIHMDDADTSAAQALMPVLERKAGRLLVNGFPTGVEVSDTMVHGGPYPASTNFGATSVGTLSIRRFLRPVCYQNMPDALLPGDLA